MPRNKFLMLMSAAVIASVGGMVSAQALDSNLVEIEQIGADNSADIVQAGTNNNVGLETLPFLQDGLFNDLSVVQAGVRNAVGVLGGILLQQGQMTSATVFNRIGIDQISSDNVIASVEQRSTGSVPNGANTMVLEQSGGNANVIDMARQIQLAGQAPNEMTLRQTGAQNRVVLASQTANTTVRNEANVMNVALAGSRNGIYDLRGVAGLPMLQSSTLIQRGGVIDPRGNGNFIDMVITGDDNAFAILQSGRMNSVGFVSVAGNQNDLGLRQDGDENDIMVGQVLGDGNQIGIDQMGTNLAEVNIVNFSNDNSVSIDQTGINDAFALISGDGNIVEMVQDFDSGLGGDNIASVEIAGAGNFTSIRQAGDNTATFRMTGDGNNSARVISVEAAVHGLSEGVIVQTGSQNDFDAEVIGNSNVVASLQLGDLNSILLFVDGDENEAAFLQSGNNNSASVTQIGIANRAMIRQ